MSGAAKHGAIIIQPDGSMEGPVREAPSFLCPPDRCRMVTTPVESYCVICGRTEELPMVSELTPSYIEGSGGTTHNTPLGKFAGSLRGDRHHRIGSQPPSPFRSRDANGHTIRGEQYRALRALFYPGRARRKSSGWEARKELLRAQAVLRLSPTVIAEAERGIDNGVRTGAFRGRSIPTTVVGILYAVMRSPRFRIPVSMDRLCAVNGGDPVQAGRCVKEIRRRLKIPAWYPLAADHFRFDATRMDMSREEIETGLSWLNDPGVQLLRNSPATLAAGCVYLLGIRGRPVHLPKRSQKKVAEQTDVTEVAIRTAVKSLVDVLRDSKGRLPGE